MLCSEGFVPDSSGMKPMLLLGQVLQDRGMGLLHFVLRLFPIVKEGGMKLTSQTWILFGLKGDHQSEKLLLGNARIGSYDYFTLKF